MSSLLHLPCIKYAVCVRWVLSIDSLLQMEMSLEHATEYHSLRLCEEETIASARAPRGQNGGRANEYVPQLGSRTWSVEGEVCALA